MNRRFFIEYYQRFPIQFCRSLPIEANALVLVGHVLLLDRFTGNSYQSYQGFPIEIKDFLLKQIEANRLIMDFLLKEARDLTNALVLVEHVALLELAEADEDRGVSYSTSSEIYYH